MLSRFEMIKTVYLRQSYRRHLLGAPVQHILVNISLETRRSRPVLIIAFYLPLGQTTFTRVLNLSESERSITLTLFYHLLEFHFGNNYCKLSFF